VKADPVQLAAALEAVERGQRLTPEQLVAWLDREPTAGAHPAKKPAATAWCPVYGDDGCRFEFSEPAAAAGKPICVGAVCRAVELGERAPGGTK